MKNHGTCVLFFALSKNIIFPVHFNIKHVEKFQVSKKKQVNFESGYEIICR